MASKIRGQHMSRIQGDQKVSVNLTITIAIKGTQWKYISHTVYSKEMYSEGNRNKSRHFRTPAFKFRGQHMSKIQGDKKVSVHLTITITRYTETF